MTFIFEEIPDSRRIATDPPAMDFTYGASGEFDEGVVWSYALGNTSAYVDTVLGRLYRGSVEVREKGHKQYEVTVPYGQKKKETGSFSWTFDTSGATVKIKVAREHMGSFPSGGGMDANPHKGAIGVKLDGDVDGTEIIIPALKINCTFKHAQGIVTLGHAKNLARATGCTNANAYLDNEFAGGELLFLGATGGDGTDSDAELNYQFAASQNVDDLSFGDISSIVKEGWHVAWVEFKNEEASGAAATQPKRVHIERVYNALDFASVFGWG